MKKLIIAVTIVVAAMVSEASLFSWKYSTKTQVAGLDGATGYLVLGSYDTAPVFENLGQIADLAKYDAIATTTKTKPAFSNSIAAMQVDGATAANPNYYLILVNSDKTGYWVGSVQDATPYLYEPGGSAPGTAQTLPDTVAFTNFSSGDVPEPTSAMLLLLGVAGLALRRKQA